MRRSSPDEEEDDVINVSEITDYLYCRRAWHYRISGEESSSPHLGAGIAHHRRYETRRVRAVIYRRIFAVLTLLLLIGLGLLAMKWMNGSAGR